MSLKNKILKSEFLKNTLTLTIGTSVAQFFPMLLYPVLARIFTPAEFGMLAILSSITGILAVLATGKYEGSILITNTKKDAANIVGLVIILSFTILSISFVVLKIFSNQFGVWFNNSDLKYWLFIPPISAFAIIIYELYNEWCVRNKYFVSLSWNKIINSGGIVLNKTILGFVKISSNGLVLGDLFGRIISALICVFRAVKKDKDSFLQISRKRMFVLSKKYKNFPKFYFPATLLDVANTQIPTLMIGAVFFSTEVGYFSMAGSLLSVPASVISRAVMDVFRQRANDEWIKYGNCITIYKKTVWYMLLIIFPISVILMFILPDLFSFVLGEKWEVAGLYARILLPNVAILFIFQVVSAVFIIADKMKASLYWQVFSIILTVTALSIGVFVFQDIIITLICFVVARIVANLSRFYLTYKYAKGEI